MKKNNQDKVFHWYIVKSASGQEKKTAELLRQRVRATDMNDFIKEVVVPTQEKIVIKRGKKQTVEERIFPGYILVNMIANDDTIHLIRNTDGIAGFVGYSAVTKRIKPLPEKEVKGILEFTKIKQQPTFHSSFQIGDPVKVVDGPFKEFVGSVQEVNESKGRLTVLLSIFGRETPVQLDFLQVTKL
ncbi:MAG: transcription termination/antitermination protein NusG [Candidatus Dojkabacteria bacterium]